MRSLQALKKRAEKSALLRFGGRRRCKLIGACVLRQKKKEMLTDEQRDDFGRRFSTVLLDLLCVHQDPDACALRAEVRQLRSDVEAATEALRAEVGAAVDGLRADVESCEGPSVDMQQLRSDVDAATAALRAELQADIESREGPRVIDDVMCVMESAVSQLRALAI